MVLCLALSYGGREEITHAAKRIAARVASGQITLDEVDPAMLDEELHHRVIPWDPDLVIRTSGEQRLSNFLLWQSAYAELFFTDVTWPEFGRSELLKALAAFRERERRYGKVLDPDPEDRTPPHKAVAC
jgi:undecaprenyl diphosphate synthase